MAPNTIVSLLYAGISLRTDAATRNTKDLQNKGCARNNTIIRTAQDLKTEAQLLLFEFRLQDSRWAAHPDAKSFQGALWANDALQNLERLTVGLLSPVGRLNPAPGGLKLDWQPGVDELALKSKVDELERTKIRVEEIMDDPIDQRRPQIVVSARGDNVDPVDLTSKVPTPSMQPSRLVKISANRTLTLSATRSVEVFLQARQGP